VWVKDTFSFWPGPTISSATSRSSSWPARAGRWAQCAGQRDDGAGVRPAHRHKEHPTEKPLDLWRKLVRYHSDRAVADMFVGSGTTLVACELEGRQGFGMEITPKCCAVALERLSGMDLRCDLLEAVP